MLFLYIIFHIQIDILFDFIAVFSDIYHEILRASFLPKTANDCSDMLEN